MENLGTSKTPPSRDRNEQISFNVDDNNNAGVSHSPLDLGGGGTARAPKIDRPAPPKTAVVEKTAEKTIPAERVTGVRTFFTKLHAGAINFLDEQITRWLKDNPEISIKRTNVITGEIQGKKTEPNIIVTVWY